MTRLPHEEIDWTLAHVVDGPVPYYYESLKRENPSLLPSPEEEMDSSKVDLYNGARALYAVQERFANGGGGYTDDVADPLKPDGEKRMTRLPHEEIDWTLAHVVDGPVPYYYESLKRENPSLLPSPEEEMDSSKVDLYNGARALYAVQERFAKY
ncbi:hypothetical protein ZWY2020_012196 [Hordeum vulgare]|nr:hypothetical protein ZWY2020_012196 [Hordeum vulgare]